MGQYTSIKFEGIVKEEYREEIERLLSLKKDDSIYNYWEFSNIDMFKEFSKVNRSHFIPDGWSASIPEEWDQDKNKYEVDTGYWNFVCSSKSYNGTYKAFFKLIPKFIKELIYLEGYNEEDSFSCKYELIDNKIVCVNDKFIQYALEDEQTPISTDLSKYDGENY